MSVVHAGSLTSLSLKGPSMQQPFRSNIKTLTNLQHLHMEGIHFEISFCDMPALQEITLLNINTGMIDFSGIAQQAAIYCPDLVSLTIGGYPSPFWAHIMRYSPYAYLLRSLRKAMRRRCPTGWRMWKGVPLTIAGFQCPSAIPNATSTPVIIELVR